MKVINHRCPTCGGNMEYDDKKRFICNYCGYVKLDVFIKGEDSSIPEYFDYNCQKCNYHTLLKYDSNTKLLCPVCHIELNCKKILLNSFLTCDLSLEGAKRRYINETKYFESSPLFLPKEFVSPEFTLKYIKVIRYSGVIFLECNSKKVRYIFKDIFIPCEKDFLYSHLLDFSTRVINSNEIDSNSNKDMYCFSGSLCDDKKFSNEEILKDLEMACILDFMSLFSCAKNDINVNNSIKLMDYIYVPFYHAEISYNGEIYNQYICGYKKSRFDKSKNDVDVLCYLSFPNLDEKIERSVNRKGSFFISFAAVCIFLVICTLGILLYLAGIVGWILGIIIMISYLSFYDKVLIKYISRRKYVLYNKEVSKEKFFAELVKGKNVVEKRK